VSIRSRIRICIKEFKYLYPAKCYLSSRKYDPGCSSQIPDYDFFHPGSRGKKTPDPGNPDPDPKQCNNIKEIVLNSVVSLRDPEF
jgi:hypothetical protein